MILALAGGAGGLVKTVSVMLVSGLPFLSRALVPTGIFMVSLPSAEVAENAVCTTPLLSTLKLDWVPEKFVTTFDVITPPVPPDEVVVVVIVTDKFNSVVAPLCQIAVWPVETPFTRKVMVAPS
jgi:hypothetical protein